MTRIPLTIASTYVPEWGVLEGLRELVQNFLDAGGLEYGEPVYKDGFVSMPNPGAVLSRDALLLGSTSKANRDDQRGQFGEGLKLGTLALCRAGRSVAIEAGGERWEASIEDAPEFGGRRVLVWNVEPSEVPHVSVEVGGVTADEWDAARALFRDLRTDAHADTDRGALLTDATDRGAIYVKGIRIATDDQLAWGYDLRYADVDRDRRLVRDFELGWEAGCVLLGAMRDGAVTPDAVLAAVESAAKDASAFEYPSVCGDESLAMLVAAFVTKHGDAIPVKDAADKHRLDHLGKAAIIVPAQAERLFRRHFGSFADIVKAALNEVVARHEWESLTATERQSLTWALDEVAAIVNSRPTVAIVTYREDRTLGRFMGGNIEIARRILTDRYETLATLVHEVSHWLGTDGDHAHGAAIEEIWTALARRWHAADLALAAK